MAVGAVSESTSGWLKCPMPLLFNVRPAPAAAELAKSTGVDMRLYRIIYNAIDILKPRKGMLPAMTRSHPTCLSVRSSVSAAWAPAGCAHGRPYSALC